VYAEVATDRLGDRKHVSRSHDSKRPEPAPGERRQEPRFVASGPCYLVLSGGAMQACARGSILDVSRNGLRVRSRIEALPAMNIEVSSMNAFWSAALCATVRKITTETTSSAFVFRRR